MNYAMTIVGILTQLLFEKWNNFTVLSTFFFGNVKGNKSILSMPTAILSSENSRHVNTFNKYFPPK